MLCLAGLGTSAARGSDRAAHKLAAGGESLPNRHFSFYIKSVKVNSILNTHIVFELIDPVHNLSFFVKT